MCVVIQEKASENMMLATCRALALASGLNYVILD